MKKMFVLMLAVLALASLAVSAMAEVPVVAKVEYEGFGFVDLDFRGGVQYMDAKVNVQDADGFVYETRIWERDDDDLSFKVENIVAGKTYSFTVSGVRSGYSGEYGSVSGEFVVPEEGALAIRNADYDAEDRELEIEFVGRVNYSNPVVEVRDAAGNSYETRIVEKDNDSIEVSVKGLSRGESYAAFVSGVAAMDSGMPGSASVDFVAR